MERKISRPVYDERDAEITQKSKSSAWDFTAAAIEIFTVICVVKENPAWKGALALLFFGMAANTFCKFDQYEGKAFFLGGLLLSAATLALLAWFIIGA